MEELLIPVSLFAMVVLVVYFSGKYNYQLKKLVIESGKEIEFPKKQWSVLEFALIFIGVGVGLLVSLIPHSMELPDHIIAITTAASILLFGGIGLIASIFIRRKFDK